MDRKFINSTLPKIFYGGDYNPEQWDKNVWERDFTLMKKARCNAMSIGIFAWSALEPQEGVFDFSWLDEIMDRLAAEGMFAVLATPTAAQPAWMSHKYPEVLRQGPDNPTGKHGFRVNYCPSSSIYREKCRIITTQLARRYRNHPALILWHINNEYYKECHCPRCVSQFRDFLKEKYGSLDALNSQWWTSHWSHTYSSWDQIGSAYIWPQIEWSVPGQRLDWCRFTVQQQVACAQNEIEIIKQYTPRIPVTTNGHMTFTGTTDWSRFASSLDVMSVDPYPRFQGREERDWGKAVEFSFLYDYYRAMKRKPFVRMEGAPAGGVGKRQMRPGILELTAMQAVAHGADTIQFFQWRNGRGGTEKFHGAMVEHEGSEKQRSFRSITRLGEELERIQQIAGTCTPSRCAIIWDKENYWSLELSSSARGEEKGYLAASLRHYRSLSRLGIAIDVIPMDFDFSPYNLIIIPLLYLQKKGTAEKIKEFVFSGGTLVMSYYSGYTNENDQVFEGGFPAPFRDLQGIWSDELDALEDGESKSFTMTDDNRLGIRGTFKGYFFVDSLVNEGAENLALLDEDYYKGQPILTCRAYGKGLSFYLGIDPEQKFYDLFYSRIVQDISLLKAPVDELPEGVGSGIRCDNERIYLILYSFKEERITINLTRNDGFFLLSGESCRDRITLESRSNIVLYFPRD